jgi:hypothetical protein
MPMGALFGGGLFMIFAPTAAIMTGYKKRAPIGPDDMKKIVPLAGLAGATLGAAFAGLATGASVPPVKAGSLKPQSATEAQELREAERSRQFNVAVRTGIGGAILGTFFGAIIGVRGKGLLVPAAIGGCLNAGVNVASARKSPAERSAAQK